MNLNLNPKTLHLLMEFTQGLGALSVVCSLPGIAVVAPWAGIVGGVASGVATIIKTQIIGNIPASNIPSAPASALSPSS